MSFLYDFAFLFVALFALGFTIFIHELGHFLAARNRGLVIKKFSIGFGPKVFGWTRNGVEYRLSAIPFGGYVALPQLADMGRVEGADEKDSSGDSRPDLWDDDEDERDEEDTSFDVALDFLFGFALDDREDKKEEERADGDSSIVSNP